VALAVFDEFFSREQAALVRYCWGLTVDREAARDVAQEAMTRAYREWATVGADGSNPTAWTRTVALNLVRSQWRRDEVAADRAGALVAERRSTEVDTAGDVDLDRALRSLPARQREAVVLHHLLDLSVADSAALMGVGESTVKVHLQRGRAALADVLEVTE